MAFEMSVLVLSDERASKRPFTAHSVIVAIGAGQAMGLGLPLEFWHWELEVCDIRISLNVLLPLLSDVISS